MVTEVGASAFRAVQQAAAKARQEFMRKPKTRSNLQKIGEFVKAASKKAAAAARKGLKKSKPALRRAARSASRLAEEIGDGIEEGFEGPIEEPKRFMGADGPVMTVDDVPKVGMAEFEDRRVAENVAKQVRQKFRTKCFVRGQGNLMGGQTFVLWVCPPGATEFIEKAKRDAAKASRDADGTGLFDDLKSSGGNLLNTAGRADPGTEDSFFGVPGDLFDR